jgi:hypothetical protein
MSRARSITLCLIAIAGFAVTSWAIRGLAAFTRYPTTDAIADSTRRVLSDPAVDTLFVGTSRTENMVSPDIFDAAMSAAGHPTHSYVAAMPAMGVPEIEPLLDAILRGHPCCLKVVFLEPDFATVTPPSYRSMHFFSLTNTLHTLAYIGTLNTILAGIRRWDILSDTIYWASLYTLNIGLLHFVTDNALLDRSTVRMSRGFFSYPPNPAFFNNSEAVASYQQQEKEIADVYRRKSDFTDLLTDGQWAFFVRIVRRLQAHGLQVILLHPPQEVFWRYGASYAVDYGRRCIPEVPLFDFSDPAEYPQFFDLKYRLDSDHLNTLGVPLYTTEIAEKTLAYMAHGPNSACNDE